MIDPRSWLYTVMQHSLTVEIWSSFANEDNSISANGVTFISTPCEHRADLHLCGQSDNYVCSYLFMAYSPVNRTESPQGFWLNQIWHKLNTIRNMHILVFTNVKQISIIRKLVLSVLLSWNMANKVRRCWYHWPFRCGVSIAGLKLYTKKEWTIIIAN